MYSTYPSGFLCPIWYSKPSRFINTPVKNTKLVSGRRIWMYTGREMSCVKSSAGITVLSLAWRRYVGLNFRGARGESASSVWRRASLSFLAHLRLSLSSFIPLQHTEPPDSWKTPSRFKAFLPVCLGPRIALLMSAFTFPSRLWECSFNLALCPWLGWVCYSYTSCLSLLECRTTHFTGQLCWYPHMCVGLCSILHI